MPDDLVDRIAKARKERQTAESAQQELAIRRSQAVEESGDILWRGIVAEVKRLVDKFNSICPLSRVAFSEKTSENAGDPPLSFSVRRQTFPIAQLEVWKNSKYFIEFSASRMNGPFCGAEAEDGRIEFRADGSRNVWMVTSRGDLLATVQEAAEHLLNPVLPE